MLARRTVVTSINCTPNISPYLSCNDNAGTCAVLSLEMVRVDAGSDVDRHGNSVAREVPGRTGVTHCSGVVV